MYSCCVDRSQPRLKSLSIVVDELEKGTFTALTPEGRQVNASDFIILTVRLNEILTTLPVRVVADGEMHMPVSFKLTGPSPFLRLKLKQVLTNFENHGRRKNACEHSNHWSKVII